MCTITISRDMTENRYTIVAKDHATGSPEACAAMSFLMCSLVNWAKQKAQRVKYKLEPGNSRVEWVSKNPQVFEYAVIACRALKINFPEQFEVLKG